MNLGDYRRVHPSSIRQPMEDNKPETRYEIQNRNKSRRAKTGSAHRAEHHSNKTRRQPSAERFVRPTLKPSISGIQPGKPMAAGTSTAKRADARLAAAMFRVPVKCTPALRGILLVVVRSSFECKIGPPTSSADFGAAVFVPRFAPNEDWRRRELNPRPWPINQPRLHA